MYGGGYDSLCDSSSYQLCVLHIGAKIAFPLHVLNPNHLPRFQDVPEVFGLKNKSACNCGGELNYLPAVDGLDLGILLGAWNPPPLALAVVGSGQETVGSEELAAVSSQPLAPKKTDVAKVFSSACFQYRKIRLIPVGSDSF